MNIGINLSITGTIVLNPPVSEPGESLGPELVTNGPGGAYIGDFTAGSGGFTVSGAAWTIGGGVAAANDFEIGYMTVTAPHEALVAGRTYRFTFTVTSDASGGSLIIPFAGDTAGTNRTDNGTYTEDLVYSGTSGLRIRTVESTGNTRIDDWSVKEVL